MTVNSRDAQQKGWSLAQELVSTVTERIFNTQSVRLIMTLFNRTWSKNLPVPGYKIFARDLAMTFLTVFLTM